MKAFTNKSVCALVAICLLTACAQKEGPVEPPVVEEETVVEAAPVVSLPPAEKTQETPVTKLVSAPVEPTVTAPAKTTNYTAEELMEKLKKWEQNLKTFSADFNQVSSYDGVEINRSQGRLYYDLANQLLRWEVLTKTNEIDQVGISNKKDIVILDETLQPVTTLSWKEWQKGQANQALFDIGNYADLSAKHNVRVSQQDGQQAVLEFTSKQEGENYILSITLSKKDFFPIAIAITSDDMLTVTELVSSRKNEPLEMDLFGGFFK